MPSPLSSIASETPLALIGGGRMGSALLTGWLAGGLDPDAVVVVEPFADTQAALREAHPGLQVVDSADDISAAPSVIILAVKPQVMAEAITPHAHYSALFISIAAGKTLSFFESHLGTDKAIVRVMPNTPAAVGAGISAAIGNEQVTADHQALATALLEAAGQVVWVPDEGDMDAVTAVSGSGPAYVFLLTECLTQAGVEAGLDAELAAQLARQTVIGAGALMAEDPTDAGQLRENVTSPGGTTQAALDIFMTKDRLADMVAEAVEAAKQRSIDLSD